MDRGLYSRIYYYHMCDDIGNLVYYKQYNGYEKWIEYNTKNQVVHTKDSYNYEEWYKYKNRKLLFNKPCEIVIRITNSNKVKQWYYHDSLGRVNKYKNSFGDRYKIKYHKDGKIIYFKTKHYKKKYIYNLQDELLYSEDSHGNKQWYNRDKDGIMNIDID